LVDIYSAWQPLSIDPEVKGQGHAIIRYAAGMNMHVDRAA